MKRAELFRYVALVVDDDTLTGHFELDGRHFEERVTFQGVDSLQTEQVTTLAQLWFLVAGLSYYKAGAPRRIDLGALALGEKGRAFFDAALRDGLGEFSYRNDLPLDDVVIEGGTHVTPLRVTLDHNRVLTPFGGGIDSVVTVTQLAKSLDQALFIVSPPSGHFAPLEATASVANLPIVRATRSLDPQILEANDEFFHGHVPVTAMITMLAVIAAVASGRSGVVMSNEHSASEPNVRWHERDINHQWSKSHECEMLLSDAVAERIGDDFWVASFLRNRSELWVAQRFSKETQYHDVFRSCNRAFRQSSAERLASWCGECDKCLFINLILAPFIPRARLKSIFGGEPLTNAALLPQLRVLVGLDQLHKPFECVGDPTESSVALRYVAEIPEWSDVMELRHLSLLVSPDRDFDELLEEQGASRVPAHWIR